MLRDFSEWTFTRALGTWADLGYDHVSGRFHERLDANGRPLDVPHRAMVQARQIYVFANAASLGWRPGHAARLAETAMNGLLRDYLTTSGGTVSFRFSVTADGKVVSELRDSYTHAFVLFALAWLYRLNGDRTLLDVADRTIAFIDATLADSVHGGLYDASPTTERSKRQNPLMHLLEAYLCLEQCAPGRGYLERCRMLVNFVRQRLVRVHPGVLLEYFAEDWGPHPNPAKSGAWEPGHHLEWVWLLSEYGRLAGEDVTGLADLLWRSAVSNGVSADGLLVDEAGLDLAVSKGSHRVWPHTEGIKAAAARYAAGHEMARPFADGMARILLTTFLDRPFAGGWIDHVGADGRPLIDYVPASSLYHIFFAAAVARATWPGDTGALNPPGHAPPH